MDSNVGSKLEEEVVRLRQEVIELKEEVEELKRTAIKYKDIIEIQKLPFRRD